MVIITCFSIWDWEEGNRIAYFPNRHQKQNRIAALELINAHNRAMLLTATGSFMLPLVIFCHQCRLKYDMM